MFRYLKFKLGFYGLFVIAMTGSFSTLTMVEEVSGEIQLAMQNSEQSSKDQVNQREKELSLEFFDKVKHLDSFEHRKQALVKKYVSLSLNLEKMQVVLRGLKSADMALSVNPVENTLMLEHRKIISERQFVVERILEGLLSQYQLLEVLENLQKASGLKEPAQAGNEEEIRWTKEELRRLQERESLNWMLLKISEALHYLRTDVTKELNLLQKK